MALLGLHCCAGFSLAVARRGYSLLPGTGFSLRRVFLLQGLCGLRALGCTGFSTCHVRAQQLWFQGSRPQAQYLWHMGFMWDLPGAGIELVSPALAGRFFTTEPPGKPSKSSNPTSPLTPQVSFPIYVLPLQGHPTPVLLPGKSHGWRSLVGCSPWGC